MLNISLQIPNSNNELYAISFNQNKSMSELIEWIYENFNEFFNLKDKQKIYMHNKTNGQNYRSSNQQLISCLKQNDILAINEQEVQKQIIRLTLLGELGSAQFEIQDDTTIQELFTFTISHFQIPPLIKLDLVYENRSLSKFDKFTTLAQLNVKDQDKIYMTHQYVVDLKQIYINIDYKEAGKSYQLRFNKSDTLETLVDTVYKCFGVQKDTAIIDLTIKGISYNNENQRKQTLSQIDFDDGNKVEIKFRYYGGR